MKKTTRMLLAPGKTKEKAKKQAKNWFRGNPNRLKVNLKLDTEIVSFSRKDILSDVI